ncbi:unnamed protein product [Gemmataceae bacterium]|jgi:hypothetical protein|nr:unnamed protein product [Gemmataceae bacterium]VTT97690.1 unnamed protein product [Gemmataceae bacterium]
MRTCAILALSLFAAAARAEDKPVVREIPTADLKVTFPEQGKAGVPTVIETADDLAKSPVLKDAAEAVAKLVDFKTEKLVLFAWAGSGQDKLALTAKEVDKKTVLVTEYAPGRTRDLRQHVKLYAVPKAAAFGK